MKNNLFSVTASFLDIRPKLFGRIEESKRKQNASIAINKIKDICKSGPDIIRKLLTQTSAASTSTASSSASSSQNSNIVSQNKKKSDVVHLQFFDLDRNATKSKTQQKKFGIDREIYHFMSEPSKNILPPDFWIYNNNKMIVSNYLHLFKRNPINRFKK